MTISSVALRTPLRTPFFFTHNTVTPAKNLLHIDKYPRPPDRCVALRHCIPIQALAVFLVISAAAPDPCEASRNESALCGEVTAMSSAASLPARYDGVQTSAGRRWFQTGLIQVRGSRPGLSWTGFCPARAAQANDLFTNTRSSQRRCERDGLFASESWSLGRDVGCGSLSRPPQAPTS